MRLNANVFGPLIAVGAAVSLVAGGFALEIGKPSANPGAQAKNAVLVVRGYACAAPEKTTVSARAEGVVNGKRESIPLKLISLSGESTYAITRQWPAEGKWVITLVEANPRFPSQPSAIVKMNGNSVDWASITRLQRSPSPQEIDVALNSAALTSKL
jgi:hypothetical protein